MDPEKREAGPSGLTELGRQSSGRPEQWEYIGKNTGKKGASQRELQRSIEGIPNVVNCVRICADMG